MLNSREMATLCWLGIAVLWVLNKKELRRDISRLLKLFLQPPIIISLLAMFAWIGCELWIGNWLSLWSTALAKGTVLWVVGTAIVLLFNCQQVSSDPQAFRQADYVPSCRRCRLRGVLHKFVRDGPACGYSCCSP